VLGDGYELIVVDDDSPDRTWELAHELARSHPRVRVVRRQNERGLSTAVVRGWQIARGQVLGVIDADLQHPPEVAIDLWRRMEAGADLAVGSRHVEGGGVSDWSLARRILSRGAQVVGLLVLPSVVGRVSDPMSGYFMVRRSALAGREMSPLGYKILIEVLGRAAIGKIAEVGYVFRERDRGESKVTRKVYLDYVAHLARLRLATLFRRQ
jgi:dolichol-phosphate mannosyltransferase